MERNSREDTAETVVGIAGVLTAGGVLTFALFPLLLPTVVLLGVLALPLLPLVLVGALIWPFYVLSRAALRRMRGPGPSRCQRESARAGHTAITTTPTTLSSSPAARPVRSP
jgi:hypothetical protein